VDILNKLMLNNNVDLRGHMVYNKEGKEVVNFGKHKGTLVVDVLQKEPSFYDWILKSEFPLDTKRETDGDQAADVQQTVIAAENRPVTCTHSKFPNHLSKREYYLTLPGLLRCSPRTGARP
jgi:hypothetical protein